MPGLDYSLKVACPEIIDGEPCKGDFKFDFLVKEDKDDPDFPIKCDKCSKKRKPRELLSGFSSIEKHSPSDLVQRRREFSLAKEETPCPRAFSIEPVDRKYFDPRGWFKEEITGQKLRLKLYSEYSLIEVHSVDFEIKPGWIKWLGPIASLTSLALAGAAVPLTGRISNTDI